MKLLALAAALLLTGCASSSRVSGLERRIYWSEQYISAHEEIVEMVWDSLPKRERLYFDWTVGKVRRAEAKEAEDNRIRRAILRECRLTFWRCW